MFVLLQSELPIHSSYLALEDLSAGEGIHRQTARGKSPSDNIRTVVVKRPAKGTSSPDDLYTNTWYTLSAIAPNNTLVAGTIKANWNRQLDTVDRCVYRSWYTVQAGAAENIADAELKIHNVEQPTQSTVAGRSCSIGLIPP